MAMMYKISLKRGIVVMNSSGKRRIESLCFHILVLNNEFAQHFFRIA